MKDTNKTRIFNFSTKYDCDLLILAAGFEERCLTFIKKYKYSKDIKNVILLKYSTHESDNKKNLNYITSHFEKNLHRKPLICDISTFEVKNNPKNLNDNFKKFNEYGIKNIIIDITSMTHFLFFQILRSVENKYPFSSVRIVYTEASEYFPNPNEETRILEKMQNGLIAEDILSRGLRDVFILKDFIGNFKPNLPICLLMLVGYEVYRTEGIIEQYAPNKAVFFYGKSSVEKFSKRADFSRNIHKLKGVDKLVPTREDEISTLHVDEILKKLNDFYDLFVHKNNICVVPQCSKMQTVASYMFCKAHKDVQAVFTQPVNFQVDKYSKGSRLTYEYSL